MSAIEDVRTLLSTRLVQDPEQYAVAVCAAPMLCGVPVTPAEYLWSHTGAIRVTDDHETLGRLSDVSVLLGREVVNCRRLDYSDDVRAALSDAGRQTRGSINDWLLACISMHEKAWLLATTQNPLTGQLLVVRFALPCETLNMTVENAAADCVTALFA